jgi:hypothetical protein
MEQNHPKQKTTLLVEISFVMQEYKVCADIVWALYEQNGMGVLAPLVSLYDHLSLYSRMKFS